MKHKLAFCALLPLMSLLACTEPIRVDLEEGQPMIGVEASFTDQLKHHEAVLSYTPDFYNTSDVEMIRGAIVRVTDGIDTIRYFESDDEMGHYYTDLVAGKKNTLYHLLVDVPDPSQPDGYAHLTAQSFMKDNVETIDSLLLKHYTLSAFFHDSTICLYPYFQSLPDKSIVYMIDVWKNDTLLTDTLTKRMTIPMAGYAGFYINAGEFLEKNMEIPIAMFHLGEISEGDRIRADIASIPPDYMLFIYNVNNSMGSNPMQGPPTNVITNILPKGEAVGWFYAASVVSGETVWHETRP